MAKYKYATKPPNISTMPPGVPYIIGNEAAERFSFYGMRSILIVFMTSYLVNQAGVLAPMQRTKRTCVRHHFVSAVYFLPILGAIMADGWLGKYCTILSLSIVYCLGHLALAFMDTAWGIAFGQENARCDRSVPDRLGRGWDQAVCVRKCRRPIRGIEQTPALEDVWLVLFLHQRRFVYLDHSLPALLANPNWGPRWAFGIPGVAMLIATIFFWAGRKNWCTSRRPVSDILREMFSREGLAPLARIAIVYVFVIVFWALWEQSNGVEWTLQAEKMDLSVFGMRLFARSRFKPRNPIPDPAFHSAC